MLFENCLEKEKQAISYKRKSTDEVLLATQENYFWLTVRGSPVTADFVSRTLVNLDELFIRMLYSATSGGTHDVHVLLTEKQTDLEGVLNHIATEMGRWDTVPKCIILSSESQFFKRKDELNVRMKACTGDKVLDVALTGKFTIPIFRYPLESKEREIGYFLSNCSGYFFEQDNRVQLLVRPVGCFRFEIGHI